MKGKRFDVKQFLGKNSVPVLFIIICAVLIPVSGLPVNYIINEAVTRLGRNSFLILIFQKKHEHKIAVAERKG